MIKNDIRNDLKLLLKAARTGIIEVWKIVVEEVERAGEYVVEQVSIATIIK